MKKLAAIFFACFLCVAVGCSMGPNKEDVEAAFKDAIARNDILGMLTNAVKIEHFDVDKIEKKENGVYEALVTISSGANLGGVKFGGTVQTTLKLKKVENKWVVLQ
ncbi:MAG: hypothetical protein AB9872_13480 [Solidesulfovibrio sp.]